MLGNGSSQYLSDVSNLLHGELVRLFDADVDIEILYNMVGVSLSSNSFFNYLESIGRRL